MTDQEIALAWDQVCSHIRNYPDISVGSFDAFITKLQPRVMSIGFLMLTADNNWIKDWIEKNYKEVILRALKDIYGIDFELVIEADTSQPAQPQPVTSPVMLPTVQPAPAPQPEVQPQVKQQENYSIEPTQPQAPAFSSEDLVKSERFDNFVTGDSNILAYELAVQVAAEPGKTRANPLFIYGKSGLGKTHLLRAIQNEINDTIPGYKTKYTDSLDLVSKLAAASRESSKDKESYKKFSDQYLSADVLLIDDVQMLATMKETKENVFQFMNTLLSQGKQIVLAADRAPKQIDMDPRYTSRFAAGVVIDVGTPSIETKLSIIKKYFEEYQEDTNSTFNLSDDVQMYIAEASSSNIRELKGALSSIVFMFEYKTQNWRSITKEQIQKILQDSFSGGSFKRLTVADIQKEVANYYKVSVTDIVGPKRSRPIAHARQVAIYLSQKMLGLTQSDIGKLFGGRDHSTIMYSVSQVATQVKENWEFKEEIELIQQMIQEA